MVIEINTTSKKSSVNTIVDIDGVPIKESAVTVNRDGISYKMTWHRGWTGWENYNNNMIDILAEVEHRWEEGMR